MASASESSPIETSIDGLLVIRLDVHADRRGWFKENWNAQILDEMGVPYLGPVQNNISFNHSRGTMRGFHAEPWDKYVSVASGLVYAAWVDLREGAGFGTTFKLEMDPSLAVFVPRGVANAFQTLEENTVYTYLVNGHWSPDAKYHNVNLSDPSLAIDWPIDISDAVVSEKDAKHPFLKDIKPIPPLKTLIIGSGGQLGRALMDVIPIAMALDLPEFDISDPSNLETVSWNDVDVVINASAYTNVDGAESIEGRRQAWATNAHGVANIAKLALRHNFTLVHVSTDYVFDGEQAEYGVDSLFSPLSVYGASKAAGELAVSLARRHYIVRTSWLIGVGRNFESIMQELAEKGVNPSVVNDQYGRLTYTNDLAAAIVHLVSSSAPYGVYNVTSGGDLTTWYEVARRVFEENGHDPNRVIPISTEQYFASKPEAARRPKNSNLTNSISESKNESTP